jgi:cyclohexanone monooxygenase
MTEETTVPGARQYEVVVIGAGFSGLYALKRLRDAGRSVHVVESARGVGGTWYHNRYPGARCDIESLDYSYSFDDDLQQEWSWTERYAAQPEILDYLNHVADRFELRRDISFGVRVTGALFDEVRAVWQVDAIDVEDAAVTIRFEARYVIMATGVLSVPREPEVTGLDVFEGDTYHTGHWPHTPVDFRGKRVAVIGTGASATQLIPLVAEDAAELYVFQRTPNFTVMTQNHPMVPAVEAEWKATYPDKRRHARTTYAGHNQPSAQDLGSEMTAEQRRVRREIRWEMGGLHIQRSFLDIMRDEMVNEEFAEFIRDKIRETVRNPETAEALTPRGFPLGTKRPCSGTNYYDTFNRDNVHLISGVAGAVERLVSDGVQTITGTYDVDAVVFATGFYGMTGALDRINPVGRDGVRLRDHWHNGPRSHLGVLTHGFPNMFLVAGPGTPSVISNIVTIIEIDVEWATDTIQFLEQAGGGTIEAEAAAEAAWVDHVNEAADATLYAKGPRAWYYASTADGKRVFMPYVGGLGLYYEKLQAATADDYRGFAVRTRAGEVSPAADDAGRQAAQAAR